MATATTSDSNSFLASFFKLESAGGIVLMIATVLALIVANSPLTSLYDQLLDVPLVVAIGTFEIDKPLLLWINDGLMAIFFFLIGLELKREFMEGELRDMRSVVLPGLGAVGGMAVPALIYVAFNMGDPMALQGWAIPAATDIAFALGILALLGSNVPVGIKVFLTTVAIFDDLGAIVIIAAFYTANISFIALGVVAACIPILYAMNRRGVDSTAPYILVGVILWTAMLKSGVHATLAGVLVALFIPMRATSDPSFSPLKHLEHNLHTVVAFFVLPVFAFANAGISFSGMGMDQVLHPIPMGIAAGLFLGKQIGIFGVCALAVKSGLASLPTGMNFKALYGTACLCGVGFTMSLFIGSLAFEETGVNMIFDERLGIIIGSLASGILGYLLLKGALKEYLQKPSEAVA